MARKSMERVMDEGGDVLAWQALADRHEEAGDGAAAARLRRRVRLAPVLAEALRAMGAPASFVYDSVNLGDRYRIRVWRRKVKLILTLMRNTTGGGVVGIARMTVEYGLLGSDDYLMRRCGEVIDRLSDYQGSDRQRMLEGWR
jgi:hypothetical protein